MDALADQITIFSHHRANRAILTKPSKVIIILDPWYPLFKRKKKKNGKGFLLTLVIYCYYFLFQVFFFHFFSSFFLSKSQSKTILKRKKRSTVIIRNPMLLSSLFLPFFEFLNVFLRQIIRINEKVFMIHVLESSLKQLG